MAPRIVIEWLPVCYSNWIGYNFEFHADSAQSDLKLGSHQLIGLLCLRQTSIHKKIAKFYSVSFQVNLKKICIFVFF